MLKIVYDTAFLSALLLTFAIQLPATIAAAYVLCAGYIMVAYDRSVVTNNQMFAYAVAMVPCMLAVLNFKHGLTSVVYLLALPLVIMAAKVFGAKSLEHVEACLRNFFWLFVLGIAVGLALHWDEPEPLGAIFPDSSTNGLPSYLIVVQIAYSLAHYLKYHRLPLLSACATIVVAVFGLGRGSMITGALILLFSLLTNVTISRSKTDRKVFLIALSVLVPLGAMYLAYNFSEIKAAVELAIEGSKFSEGVLDEHRGRIIHDYLAKMDAWTFMFGTDYANTSISQYYGGNPHNSFIRAHSFYGVAALILIFIPVTMVAVARRHAGQKFVALIFIIFALLRATTEPIFFQALWIFSIFFIFSCSLISRRNYPSARFSMFDTIKYIVSKILKKARFSAIRHSIVHPTAKVESGTAFVESTMDRHSFCGYDCDIYAASIGSFTSIANGVVVGGARHPMEWVGMSPVFYAGRDSVKAKFSEHPLDPPPRTRIGHDVWIGRSAIVLSGVTIGDGAVIGAGSVVTKDVPAYAIVAGNPAKFIRHRFEAAVIESLGRIKWWDFSESQLTELARHIRDPEKFIAVAQQQANIK